MKLEALVAPLMTKQVAGPTDIFIRGMTYDSRKVEPGFVFFAVRGAKLDGHDFIADAVARGAAAVVMDKPVAALGATGILVPDTRAAMAVMARLFYGDPSQKLKVIGVTGTNGKTTTTHLITAIFRQAGFQTGLIGTIYNRIGERELPVTNTTPDSLDLQGLFAAMVDAGVQYVAIEVSSHALALNRVAGCEFDTGVFTNLTRDHLDFHITMEEYAAAKAGLFASLGGPGAGKPGPKTAVINLDDPAHTVMQKATTAGVITYSTRQPATLTARDIHVTARGVSFIAHTPQGQVPLRLKLTGMFNVYNALAAMGAGLAHGVSLSLIQEALEAYENVPGRFERVDAGQDFAVIVDYAHTPDGLENILHTAKEFARGRIITVFGCGGDRDRTKRPIMGEIAARLSDIAIVTSDNPRTEDPEAIIDDVVKGIHDAGKRPGDYKRIADRRTAIAAALSLARPDDVVIIAGKGHETYQILKDKTIAFDDREVARTILKEMRK